MATRWIVPCGCELIYDVKDDDAIVMHEYKPCQFHKGTQIDQAHEKAINFCKSLEASKND